MYYRYRVFTSFWGKPLKSKVNCRDSGRDDDVDEVMGLLPLRLLPGLCHHPDVLISPSFPQLFREDFRPPSKKTIFFHCCSQNNISLRRHILQLDMRQL